MSWVIDSCTNCRGYVVPRKVRGCLWLMSLFWEEAVTEFFFSFSYVKKLSWIFHSKLMTITVLFTWQYNLLPDLRFELRTSLILGLVIWDGWWEFPLKFYVVTCFLYQGIWIDLGHLKTEIEEQEHLTGPAQGCLLPRGCGGLICLYSWLKYGPSSEFWQL